MSSYGSRYQETSKNHLIKYSEIENDTPHQKIPEGKFHRKTEQFIHLKLYKVHKQEIN